MRLLLPLAAALLLMAGAGAVQAMTGRELLNSCDAALRSMKGTGTDVSIAPGGQKCWTYMEAVQDMVALGDEGGHRLLGVCVPESGRIEGLVRTFATYAHAHRDELQSRASVVVLNGLLNKFPCK
jgi:hypothetical protein